LKEHFANPAATADGDTFAKECLGSAKLLKCAMQKVAAIAPTATTAERVWSNWGHVVNNKRTRLKHDTAFKCVYVYQNFRLLANTKPSIIDVQDWREFEEWLLSVHDESVEKEAPFEVDSDDDNEDDAESERSGEATDNIEDFEDGFSGDEK
jgi:hypothetical protein